MAIHAVVLQNAAVLFLDHDWFLKVLRRESLGMVIAVFSLSDVFGNERVRQVAIDTAGHRMVTRFLPGFILRRHDVAIHAGFGIRAKIGKPFSIPKGECSGSNQQPKQDGQYRRLFIQNHVRYPYFILSRVE